MSEVEKIAREGTFTLPSEAQDGGELVRLAERLSYGGASTNADAWFAVLEAADTKSIIAASAALTSPDPLIGPRMHALRDTARAMVEQKLTDRMVGQMERLERASNRLAWVGISVAVAIGLIELFAARCA
ncbi:MAG: hypothetical protein QNK04_18280 [Myxococcota bacterium]|nr:hypothetical protein [Myxococcota bacterium]